MGIDKDETERGSEASDFIISDAVTEHEQKFVFPNLLTCEYFQKQRKAYYGARDVGGLNPFRNYLTLLEGLDDIHAYNELHAKSFAKRFRGSAKEWRNCEAVFCEVIVYRAYIRGAYEGLIRKIHLEAAEADVIVERLDGSRMFLEVFCVMPSFPVPRPDEAPKAYSVNAHTQTEMASIRQKLLRKIEEQRQFSTLRENYAVIELNDTTIAGDFAVLSSLSGGYKMNIGLESGRVLSSGYDWTDSVFDDPSTRHLKGVIYFSLGHYESRKFLMNPNFKLQP